MMVGVYNRFYCRGIVCRADVYIFYVCLEVEEALLLIHTPVSACAVHSVDDISKLYAKKSFQVKE
jgi:hypothetical protein